MKYLRSFNEGSLENYLVKECYDIMTELTDKGIIVEIFDLKSFNTSYKGNIRETITMEIGNYKNSFNPGNYIDSFEHMNSFLNSEGYFYTSDGAYYNTWESKIKSFNNKLTLLIIKWEKKS